MTEWEYQEMKQAFREQSALFKANPAAMREHLDNLSVGSLFLPKKANQELRYPCTSEYLPVDVSVFLCD